MGARKRSTLQIARDRKRIARLYLKGFYQAEIADRLGISQPTVSRDLNTMIEQWQNSSLIDIDKLKRAELAKINNLELEYWEAWENSGGEIVTKTIERIASESGDDGARRAREMIKTEIKVGDFAALRGVQWCIDKRCALLGLDAPQKFAHTDKTGKKDYAFDEQARSFDALIDALGEELSSENESSSSAVDAAELETVESASLESG